MVVVCADAGWELRMVENMCGGGASTGGGGDLSVRKRSHSFLCQRLRSPLFGTSF